VWLRSVDYVLMVSDGEGVLVLTGRVEVVESVGEEDELVVIKVSWAALVSEVACGVKEEVEEVFGAGSCWVVVSGGGVEGGVLRAVVGARYVTTQSASTTR